MNIKPEKINFSDGAIGALTLPPDITQENRLKIWVTERKFDSYTTDRYRMNRHTRKRNKLYSFTHPAYNKEVVLKVSSIDNQYNLFRRINLLVSTFFSDYNFRAFNGSIQLNNIGVNCAKPVAYWTESTNSIFRKKSYYMYEKINASHSLHSFSLELSHDKNNTNNELFSQLANKTVGIVRAIHNAGFRQGDPHPGNFLVSPPKKNISKLKVEELSQIEMFMIDLDKFSKAKTSSLTLKRFFDLRCMRRCTLGPYDQYDMLKFYLREEYSLIWKYVLGFWIHGGFNPFKWIRKPKRGQ